MEKTGRSRHTQRTCIHLIVLVSVLAYKGLTVATFSLTFSVVFMFIDVRFKTCSGLKRGTVLNMQTQSNQL